MSVVTEMTSLNVSSCISHRGKEYNCDQCEPCKESFTKSALKKHMDRGKYKPQSMTPSFLCSKCGQLSKSMYDMRRHMKDDHETKRDTTLLTRQYFYFIYRYI